LGADNRSRTSAVVALYTVIGVEVLPQPGAGVPSEDLASVLVNSLHSVALKSDCDDLKAGGYMILSKLCATATLSASTLDSLTTVLVKVLP
jgi:hypothetical protein